MPESQPPAFTRHLSPTTVDDVAAVIESAAAAGTPVYPIGGGTALDFGLPRRAAGVELSLAGLDRVLDYPARDMTVTVESGVTLGDLARTLAAEGQQLPVDAPAADRATVGGLIATNWSGPRRYGYGTVRDYVIGITAVDGRGRVFKGGGRVVKNVAGYDFCKLLVGSLGTLGVITQATFKVRPLAQAAAYVGRDVPDWEVAETLLASLVRSAATPAAIELLAGPAWLEGAPSPAARLCVGVEGTRREVSAMVASLRDELSRTAPAPIEVLQAGESGSAGAAYSALNQRLIEFGAGAAPLVLKASLRPSRTIDFMRLVREIDPAASLQAHAGSGVVIARLSSLPPGFFTHELIGRLQPAAVASGGHVVVLSASGGELTRQSVWGNPDAAIDLMRAVKAQFDPADILNRGRFVF
jgi:glycolate oxidase FAD binding subunit